MTNRKLKNSELNRKTVDEFKAAAKNPCVIVLDNIRSFNNVGSIFRTADAFLLQRIVLCGITPVPPHKEIHKTALGATESVEWSYFGETADAAHELKKLGFSLVAIEQVENKISLIDFTLQKDTKYAFIFGNEIKGVSQEVVDLCDHCIEVPQFGTKHSINIAVCVGMVVWDYYSKLNKIK